MNARFQFNTGRLYTQEGQVIVATNDGATILFNDTSRSVMGAILCNEFTCDLTGTGLADHVMRCYDRGNYRGISSSEAPQLDRAAPVVHVY
jgi:hypothetical protein